MITLNKYKFFFAFGGILFFLIILWIIFMFFFNTGTLEITAKAPYNVEIYQNNKPLTEKQCVQDICTFQLKSGAYLLNIVKDGYKPQSKEITVKTGEHKKENISLQFLPILKKREISDLYLLPPQLIPFRQKIRNQISFQVINDGIFELKNIPPQIENINFAFTGRAAIIHTKEKNYFYKVSETLIELPIPPSTPVFFNSAGETIYYFLQDKKTFRSVLYSQAIDNDINLQKPTIITSFTGKLNNPILFVDSQKILLLEQNNNQSTVYIIDPKLSTRKNLFDYSYIRDIEWLSGRESFLFLGKKNPADPESLFFYDLKNGEIKELFPSNTLTIAELDSDRFLFLSGQPIDGDPKNLEGQSISFQKNPAFIIDSAGDQEPGIGLFEYSKSKNQIRLIKFFDQMELPERIEISENKKSILFSLENEVYELQFVE